MPRAKVGIERKQVAVRVPLDLWRLIRFAMVLRQEDSLQDFLYPVLQAFGELLLQEEPELKGMLRLAKENEARKTGATAPTSGPSS